MTVALMVILAVLLCGAAVLLLLQVNERQRQQDFYLGRRLEASALAGQPARMAGEGRLHKIIQGFALRAGLDSSALPVGVGPLAGGGIFLVLILGLLLGPLLAVLALSVLAALLVGWMLYREYRRMLRMHEQLPGFLEHMMRVLSTGNSLEEALAAATLECPAPLGDVFAQVNRQVRLGAQVDDTLAEVAQLCGLRELQVMALATRINRRYGGSLKRIFKSLVAAIHQQDIARREMRALTGETRFSAVVLAAVPVIMMLWFLSQNPDYYLQMWNHPVGQLLMLFSVLWQVLGVIWIWRMLSRAGEGAT